MTAIKYEPRKNGKQALTIAQEGFVARHLDMAAQLREITEVLIEAAMRGMPLLDKEGAPVMRAGKQVMVTGSKEALAAIAQAQINYTVIAHLTGSVSESSPLPTLEECSLMYEVRMTRERER